MDTYSEDIDDICIVAESNLGDIIREVVAALPEDVRTWVVRNITFVDFAGISGLACHIQTSFSSEHRCKEDLPPIRLLVIVADDGTETEKAFRIAHEIGHHWCGHHEGSAQTKEAYVSQEDDADALAHSWGFVGKSIRV